MTGQRSGSGRWRQAPDQIRQVTVFTHVRVNHLADALALVRRAAVEAGATLRFDVEETRKHGLEPGPGLEVNATVSPDVDLCLSLGGDGTILRALRDYAGTPVPVFAVNYGELGFLATVEPEELEDGVRRAFAADFEVLELPALDISGPFGQGLATNDVSVHRRPGHRVARLAYVVADDEVGRVRCDGLVVCTPAGSTGYNLANGGPVLAWGVEGFAVSFIAPHSLTARALVVAPGDRLSVLNTSRDEPVDVTLDGRLAGALAPGERFETTFRDGQSALAQIPGTSFYARLRQKFGRLSS